MTVSGLVVLVDEGQNIIFGQFLRIHTCLRIVNYDPVHPGPEETLRVADAEDEDKERILFIHHGCQEIFKIYVVNYRPTTLEKLIVSNVIHTTELYILTITMNK